MEEEELETSSGSNLVPIALAVLAILLGGAGLYFGLTANERLNPITETMEAGSSSAARLEKEIAALETKITELSAKSTDLKKTVDRMRLYANQSEKTVKQVAGGLKANRDEIVKLAERLNELAVSAVSAKPPAESVAPPASSSSARASTSTSTPVATESAGPGGTYTIKSGDYFGKIATELGIDLQALMDANPDVDHTRLRIGQVIKLPGN